MPWFVYALFGVVALMIAAVLIMADTKFHSIREDHREGFWILETISTPYRRLLGFNPESWTTTYMTDGENWWWWHEGIHEWKPEKVLVPDLRQMWLLNKHQTKEGDN